MSVSYEVIFSISYNQRIEKYYTIIEYNSIEDKQNDETENYKRLRNVIYHSTTHQSLLLQDIEVSLLL